MAVDDSSRKAAVGQGRKRSAACSGPGGGEGPVAAALGRPGGWEQWSGVPTHAGHMVEARLVVPVAMGRGGSKRSVVVAAGVTVVQRRRWIKTEDQRITTGKP